MSTYSKKDFERIAAAIGKHVADIMCHEKYFGAAAMWYRLSRDAPIGERITPFRMRKRMTEIAKAPRNGCSNISACLIPPMHRMVPRSPFWAFSHRQTMELRTRLFGQQHE